MKLLTVHGWAFCPEVFKNLPSTFEVEHHRITYRKGLREEASLIAERIDESTVLVGWSLGATLAVLASTLKKPKGLVLIGATKHFGGAWKREFIENFLRELKEDFTSKVKSFRKTVWGEPICGEVPPKEGAIKLLEEFIETDITGEFSSLDVPTLLVCGRKDGVVPFTECRKLLKLNPRRNIKRFVYDGGHFPKEFSPGDWQQILESLNQL